MRVEVRLFAILRERAGCGSLELDLADGATAADALAATGERAGLGEELARMQIAVAVNREYVRGDAVLADGDEVALIPPVSGGAEPHVRVGPEQLSLERVCGLVGRPGAGAVVVFAGTTRDLPSLEYEAYAEMAAGRIREILSDAIDRHRLEAAAAEHRTGTVALGEASVVVAVSAAHRAEAFAGAREAIDRIKAEAPIWKQEATDVDGKRSRTWVEGSPAPGADQSRSG
jgi:molybdopterin synthase catalytic subunit